MRHPLRNRLETCLTRLAFILVPALPRWFIVGLARFAGHAGYIFSRKLREIGLTNLKIAFSQTRSRADQKRILVHSFQTMALVTLDTFWFSKNTKQRIEKYTSFSREYDALFHNKRQVTFTAHYGNWEVLGMTCSHDCCWSLCKRKVEEANVSALLLFVTYCGFPTSLCHTLRGCVPVNTDN